MIKYSLFAFLFANVTSQAAVTMTIEYTANPSTPSPATVTATAVLDNSVLGTSTDYFEGSSLPPFLQDISIVVSGASSGNGTFSALQGDIGGFVFQTNGDLPDTADQINLGSFDDFNFFSSGSGDPNTPDGVFFFLIELVDGSNFQVSSISAVPEPGSFSLFALAAVGIFTRRTRS